MSAISPAPIFTAMAERHATQLPQLGDEVATLAARVEEHLKRMGAAWK